MKYDTVEITASFKDGNVLTIKRPEDPRQVKMYEQLVQEIEKL